MQGGYRAGRRTLPHSTTTKINTHACSLQVVVDGNGAPTRLLPTLCSGALTLLASIMDEWWYFRARPFRHYLPIK